VRLVRNGVPFSVVEEMTDSEIFAWQVAIGEAEGGEFSWSELRWMERK
jgi:hypothetical protein